MTVYLDNSATTAVCPEAAEKMMEIMTAGYGNPSSTHHMGRQAKKELESARSSVAGAVGCAPEEIYFKGISLLSPEYLLSFERCPFHTETPDHYALVSYLIDL